MYYVVQLVVSRNDAPPFLRDGLYLVRADNTTVLDGIAKALVAQHLIAQDYIHREAEAAPPATVKLGNPDSIRLGVDISYTDDMAKVDWDGWRKSQDAATVV